MQKVETGHYTMQAITTLTRQVIIVQQLPDDVPDIDDTTIRFVHDRDHLP